MVCLNCPLSCSREHFRDSSADMLHTISLIREFCLSISRFLLDIEFSYSETALFSDQLF